MPIGKESTWSAPRLEDAKKVEQPRWDAATDARISAFANELDLSNPLPPWMGTDIKKAGQLVRPNLDGPDGGGYTETVMGFQEAAWRKIKDSLETTPENQLRNALRAWQHPAGAGSRDGQHIALLNTAKAAVQGELQRRKDAERESRISAFANELDLSNPLPPWMGTDIKKAGQLVRPNLDGPDGGGYTETVMGFQDAAWRKVKDSLETTPEDQLRNVLTALRHPSGLYGDKEHVAMVEAAITTINEELRKRQA